MRLRNAGEGTHDGEGHGECPEASPGVTLERLPHAHTMLAVLAMDGIVHEIRVYQDIGMVGFDRSHPVVQLILWFDDSCRPFELLTMSLYQCEGIETREGQNMQNRGLILSSLHYIYG